MSAMWMVTAHDSYGCLLCERWAAYNSYKCLLCEQWVAHDSYRCLPCERWATRDPYRCLLCERWATRDPFGNIYMGNGNKIFNLIQTTSFWIITHPHVNILVPLHELSNLIKSTQLLLQSPFIAWALWTRTGTNTNGVQRGLQLESKTVKAMNQGRRNKRSYFWAQTN